MPYANDTREKLIKKKRKMREKEFTAGGRKISCS
jgi:hypothetical protein